jgi:hypothetical protein
LGIEVNLSSVNLHTEFRHAVSHLDDLKTANCKVSEVEDMIMEHEWKRILTRPHSTYSALVYIYLIRIPAYTLYRVYGCLKDRLGCLKAITNYRGLGNMVNIRIHTTNENLSVAPDDLPLGELHTSRNPSRCTGQGGCGTLDLVSERPIKE